MFKVFVSQLLFSLFITGITGSEQTAKISASFNNSKSAQNSGLGIGWAEASAVHHGDTGGVTLSAVSSSHSTLTIGPDGEISITSDGQGLGTGNGTAGSPSAASLEIHANGGGNGTSIISDKRIEQIKLHLSNVLV